MTIHHYVRQQNPGVVDGPRGQGPSEGSPNEKRGGGRGRRGGGANLVKE